MNEPSIIIAFGLGLLFFISPCILPLIPPYISYLAGISLSDYRDSKSSTLRFKIFLNALLFVIGFSIVFITLGATASYIGKLLFAYREILTKISGILLIFFGLQLSGLIKINIFYKIPIIKSTSEQFRYIQSLLSGIAFAIGWTPCVGPLLASILILAAASSTLPQGIILLVFFSLGLSIPFLTVALFMVPISQLIKKYSHILLYSSILSALILIGLGTLLFFSKLSAVIGWMYEHGWGISL